MLAFSMLHSNSWEISMAKKRVTPPTQAALASQFIFNPHIIWDPPPWPLYDQLGAGVAQEMMLIRLQACLLYTSCCAAVSGG